MVPGKGKNYQEKNLETWCKTEENLAISNNDSGVRDYHDDSNDVVYDDGDDDDDAKLMTMMPLWW